MADSNRRTLQAGALLLNRCKRQAIQGKGLDVAQ